MSKKMIAFILAGLLVFGVSMSALAAPHQGPPHHHSPPPGMKGPCFNQPDPGERLKAELGVLVIDGVITREQALKTLEYFNKENTAMKDMKPCQRREYQNKSRKAQTDPLSLLVKDGFISKDQAAAVEKVLKPKHFRGGKQHPFDKPGDPGNVGNQENPGNPPLEK